MKNPSSRNEKRHQATTIFKHFQAGSKTRRKSGLAFHPGAERLDERVVLSTLVSTTVAGSSVNQTLANVVNNTSLGGLTVESTNGFSTAAPPNFLTLTNGGSPFATVSYITTSASNTAFQTLALPAGNSTVQLTSSTVVTQAARGQAAAGSPQQLSASPFVLSMTGSSSDFTPSGNLYVQGARGNYIISYTSVSDNGGNAQFQGCKIIGSFGALQASPFEDIVNAGAFIVQSVAPAGGQSTSINPSVINVQASVPNDPSQKYPFSLPVISAAGFAAATEKDPKYTLVYFSNGSMAVVSYTGIAPLSTGGYELTGCISQVAGTIGAYGATSGPTANVQWTSAAPIDFEFTNNSGQSPVFVAIAGQQIDPLTGIPTYGYLSPAGNGSNSGDLWRFQAFAGQTSVPTTMVFSTSDPAGAVKHLLIPNDPYKRLDSIRMIFSVGTPPSIPVNSGKPSFPAAGNPQDPNDSTTYDFVEFTERSSPNDGILFINTTQVDQVGIPFLMQTTPADSVKSSGVGITVSRSQLFYDFGQYVTQQFSGLTGTAATDAAQAFSSLTTPNRLLNPSDSITNPPNPQTPAAFESYFDAALTTFFKKYQQPGQSFRFQRDGYFFSGQTVTGFTPAPYSTSATNNGSGLLIPPNGNVPTSLVFSIGQSLSGPGVPSGATITGVSVDGSNVTTVTYSPAGTSQPAPATYTFTLPGTYTVLQLKETDSSWNVKQGGQQYQIYAPYFSNGSPYPAGFPASTTTPPIAPPWIAQVTAASSGLMVFGNLGAFADGSSQAVTGQISGTNASGQILLDIENSIVSAFNRGIANTVPAGTDVTSAWNDNTTFYPTPSQDGSNWSNFYAGFLHNDTVSVTAPGSSVGLAYGFAYDDQGGNDPTLVSYASKVAITLQPWTAATSIVVTPAQVKTVVGQTTQFTVTAYKDKDKKVVDTNYLGKIYFDPKEIADWLPASYQFTPADNGTKTFTFVPKSAGNIQAKVADLANRLSGTADWEIDPARIAYAAGTDAGAAPVVKLFDTNNVEVLEIVPFETSFKGGVRVAVGDVNGDGFEDAAVVSGPGRVTEVLVFDGRDGQLISRQVPFGPTFKGGGFVAAGDVDGDGRDEIVVTSGSGITTRLLVLDGQTGQPIFGRTAFHQGFTGGATVATADIDGDGDAEIVVGAGAGGGGRVRVFDGRTARVLNTFQAFGTGYRGSVALTAGDLFGDVHDEIVVGSSPIHGSGSQATTIIRAFDGRGRLLSSIRSGGTSGNAGPRLGTAPDTARPGKQNLLVSGGPGSSGVESFRIVNVSPYPKRPSYVSNLVSVVYPLGSPNGPGFYLGGRQD